MRIHSLVCLVEVPAYLRTRAPVLSAPVHFACHASLGAAYRRRGGTGDPRAAGRRRPGLAGRSQTGAGGDGSDELSRLRQEERATP